MAGTNKIDRSIVVSKLNLRRSAMLVALAVLAPAAQATQPVNSSQPQENHQAATLQFFGSPTAELFSRELDASLAGVLENNFVAPHGHGSPAGFVKTSLPGYEFPAGFVNASLPGFPWAGTMWSRDGGTFMRELVMRGYYQQASLLAECLMSLVEKNPDGFYTFPEYFKGSQRAWGRELDGTASIVIGMELLWERLPEENPTRDHIRDFLFQDASPLNDFKLQLANAPLLSGTGEFGCGGSIPGVCDNVVQNNLARLALLAAARMAGQLGRSDDAAAYRRLAVKIEDGMEKYLVDKDGSWIWCIDARTLKPVPAILNAPTTRGVGSLNGVAAMDADVLGFIPEGSTWADINHSEKTFEDLYNTPLRKTEFDHYGIWTQFDKLAGGFLASPSYGQGYALQVMLLEDNSGMAAKALDWLANATYKPVPEYKLHRSSPYYFYERMYSPDAVGKIALEEGCGALNLVNVSEPLKVSRLMLGVDDSTPAYLRIVPRIPLDWKGVEARNWPILTSHGVVRADIRFVQKNGGGELTVKLAPGEQIDDLKVRMPSPHGYVWQEKKNVRVAHFVSQ
jgi:hypothetical protein